MALTPGFCQGRARCGRVVRPVRPRRAGLAVLPEEAGNHRPDLLGAVEAIDVIVQVPGSPDVNVMGGYLGWMTAAMEQAHMARWKSTGSTPRR